MPDIYIYRYPWIQMYGARVGRKVSDIPKAAVLVSKKPWSVKQRETGKSYCLPS